VKTNTIKPRRICSLCGRLALGLALAGCLTGCLIIPLNTNSGYARTNVDRHTNERFVPGRTTREDVIIALGEPDAVSRDERELAYRSEKTVALWLLVAGGEGAGGGAGGTIYKNNFYVLDFDAQGWFQAARRTKQWGMVQGTDPPSLASPVFKARDSNGAPEMIAGEPIRLEHSRSFWLGGVDGYRSKNAYTLVGRPGHLALTESSLAFATASQFANSEPVLRIPFASITDVRIDKHLLGRRLVVHCGSGSVHSFEIIKIHGLTPDKPANQAICDFISSRMRPTGAGE